MKILIRNRQRFRALDKERITQAAHNILCLLKQPEAELSILFVGEKKMTELNTAYRGISNSTHFLSFESGIEDEDRSINTVLGDVVINIPKVESQAREYSTGFYDELHRLLVHGILHLLGYDHELSEKEAGKMIKKEREIISASQKMD